MLEGWEEFLWELPKAWGRQLARVGDRCKDNRIKSAFIGVKNISQVFLCLSGEGRSPVVCVVMQDSSN